MRIRLYPIFWIFFLIFSGSIQAQVQPAVLSDSQADYFVSRNISEHYVDTTRLMSIQQVQQQAAFFVPNTYENLYNTPTSAAHWLRFTIVNKAMYTRDFVLELFDFDLEEVSLFLFQKGQLIAHQTSGFGYPFARRQVPHKNLAFDLHLAKNDTLTAYMRFYSSKRNVLEPAIRSHNRMLGYGLAEYMLLGIFYGLMLLILIFNFIYFLILRNAYFLYYVFFIVAILAYLISKNGTGFQYIWPEYPQLNPYIDKISLSVGTVFMLLFSSNYLDIGRTSHKMATLLYGAIAVQVVFSVMQLYVFSEMFYKIWAVLCIQISFVAGLVHKRSDLSSGKWYIIAFILLNVSFVISFLEYLGWIPSSIFSVYALNAGIVWQFIFLSVGVAESVRLSYQQKNKALSQLVEALNKAESMRIVELKRQMNPHFIFNALNSILHRIRSDKKEDAAQFLIQFSKLIRKTLDTSDKIFVTLEEELDSLTLYLEVESLRLGNTFQYTITTDPVLNTSGIKIPAFVLQPFVENAIWHGLIPKEGLRTLSIAITRIGYRLVIQIADNGIGRKRAMQYKAASDYESKGIWLVQERLKLIELKYAKRTSLHYEDLYAADETPTGTTVTLELEI